MAEHSVESLAAAVEEARASVPPLLRDVSPQTLATSVMPTLLKPWPEGCRAAFKKFLGPESAESHSLATPSTRKPMRTEALPLLQEDQYVVCKTCRRPVLLDVFDEHTRVCSSLPPPRERACSPGDELRAGSPSAKLQAQRAKSPVPPGPRPPSAGAGRAPPSASASSSSAGQHSVGGRPPKMPKKGTPPNAAHATGGAKGAELRRLQFARGELTVDEVCGVSSGEKICLHKLNCKYHNLTLKRMVAGRSRPFDQLLAEFNQKAHALPAGVPPADPAASLGGASYAPGAPAGLPHHAMGGRGGLLQAAALPPPPPPDPEWVAEWQRLLRTVPSLEAATRSAADYREFRQGTSQLLSRHGRPAPRGPARTRRARRTSPAPGRRATRGRPLHVAEPGRKRHRLWGLSSAELLNGEAKPAKKPKERKPKAPKGGPEPGMANAPVAGGGAALSASSPTTAGLHGALQSPGGGAMPPLRPAPTMQRSLSLQNAAAGGLQQ